MYIDLLLWICLYADVRNIATICHNSSRSLIFSLLRLQFRGDIWVAPDVFTSKNGITSFLCCY